MVELGYKQIGEGNVTLLFLHELMGSCKNYEAMLPYLDKKKFTCIFVDLRGYGESIHLMGEYSCNEATNDVINLIEHLNLENINLIAHSMSTMIAQKIALTYENKISQLILITPITAAGIQVSKSSQEKLLHDMTNNKENIEDIVKSASNRYNNAWIQERVNMAYSSSTNDARVGYMNMYLSTNFIDEVHNIKIPIKIIVGKDDFPIFSYKTVNRVFKKSYKNFEVFECLEAGHYPMIECPVYFANKLETFCT